MEKSQEMLSPRIVSEDREELFKLGKNEETGNELEKRANIVIIWAGLGTRVKTNMATKMTLEQDGALYDLQRLQEKADRYWNFSKTNEKNSFFVKVELVYLWR